MVLSRWGRIGVEEARQALPSQRLSAGERASACNLALPPGLLTQTQPQAPSSGAEGAETQRSLHGPEAAQAVHGNILITPSE